MPWSSLGNIKPQYEHWTFFEHTDWDGSLFRLTHHYDLGGVTGRLLMGAYNPVIDAWSDLQLIYPDPTRQFFINEIPPILRDQGIIGRDFGAKITFGSNVLEQDNWRITLEVWL